MNNKYLSRKLKTLTLISIILVIFIHAHNIHIHYGDGSIDAGNFKISGIIQTFISDGLCRTGVPLLFLISGFLFFTSIDRLSITVYWDKIRRRAETVLLPFLIWSAWGIFLFWVLQLLPWSKPYFATHLISVYSAQDYLDRLLVHPLNYHLWFLQVLFILQVLSPVFYLLARFVQNWLLFPVLILFWIFDYKIPGLSFYWSDGLVFFGMGAALSLNDSHRQIDKTLKPQYTVLLAALWFILLSIKIYYWEHGPWLTHYLIRKAAVLTGIFSIWHLYDLIRFRTLVLSKLMPFAFFLYLFHEPALIMSKKMFFRWISISEWSLSIGYFILPVLVIGVSYTVALVLKSVVPRTYSVLTGGR